jgi:hypothetical protein
MLKFYKLITMKKTNYYCKKTCESKINLKIIIFYKHMAILYVIMVAQTLYKGRGTTFSIFTPL